METEQYYTLFSLLPRDSVRIAMAGAAVRRGGRRERRGEARRGEESPFGNQRGDLGSATRTRGAFKIWAENATVESSLRPLAVVPGCCGAPRAVCWI
jgi:hypothetical protein